MNKYVLVPFHDMKGILENNKNQTSTPNKQNSKRLPVENILLSFLKNTKHKAKSILDHIMNSECLEWNEKGEILVNDSLIASSHITDLIKCSLFPYKNINPPGYDQFLSALSSSTP